MIRFLVIFERGSIYRTNLQSQWLPKEHEELSKELTESLCFMPLDFGFTAALYIEIATLYIVGSLSPKTKTIFSFLLIFELLRFASFLAKYD